MAMLMPAPNQNANMQPLPCPTNWLQFLRLINERRRYLLYQYVNSTGAQFGWYDVLNGKFLDQYHNPIQGATTPNSLATSFGHTSGGYRAVQVSMFVSFWLVSWKTLQDDYANWQTSGTEPLYVRQRRSILLSYARILQDNNVIDQLIEDKNTVESARASAENILTTMQTNLTNSEAQLALVKEELTQTKLELDKNKSELQLTKTDLESAKKDIKLMKAELDETKKKLESSELDKLKSELHNVKKELEMEKERSFKQVQKIIDIGKAFLNNPKDVPENPPGSPVGH